MGQLMRLWNALLQEHKEAQKRHLSYRVPRTATLSHHLRLIEAPMEHTSLEEVLSRHWRERNQPSDHAIMVVYKARLDEAMKLKSGVVLDDAKRRRDIFDMVRRQLIGSEVLSRYVQAVFPDHTAYWLFRKRFTAQLALFSLATHVLSLSKGQPHTFRFTLGSGDIIPWECQPMVNAEGRLDGGRQAQNGQDGQGHVPFRLTPNLVNFVTPSGITGVFSGSMVAAAQALVQPEGHVAALLGAVLRDETLSWHAQHRAPHHAGAMPSAELLVCLGESTATAKERLVELAAFTGNFKPVDSLIKEATASHNLCAMPSLWQPWL